MDSIKLLLRMIARPRQVSRELLAEQSIKHAFLVVIVFAAVVAIGLFLTYLGRVYPPPPDKLKVWIEAWGEFSMMPFVNLPPESYRLVLAIITVPMYLAIWIFMAGIARLLTIGFKGKTSFDQFLNLFAFSFFGFFIIAGIVDTIFSIPLNDFSYKALTLEYGPTVRQAVKIFPMVNWIFFLGLGGIYNGIAIHEAEGFSFSKTALIAAAVFACPIIAVVLIAR